MKWRPEGAAVLYGEIVRTVHRERDLGSPRLQLQSGLIANVKPVIPLSRDSGVLTSAALERSRAPPVVLLWRMIAGRRETPSGK